MFRRINTIQNFFHPKNLVFRHKKPRRPEQKETLGGNLPAFPINVEGLEEGPAKSVLESPKLFEAPNYRKDYAYSWFAEHPDKKAPWRFLSPAHKNEYRILPDEKARRAYMNDRKKHPVIVGSKKNKKTGKMEKIYLYMTHREEIKRSHQVDKDFYDKRLSPTLRVPRLRPSLTDQPELLVRNPIYALGGRVSKGIAENFRGAKVDYVPGADPDTVLKNFEKQVVNKVSPDALKGATAVVTFDPDLFGSKIPHEKYVKDMGELLKRLQELGMKVTALSPLKTFNFDFKDVPRDRNVPVFSKGGFTPDKIMARQRRNDFWKEMCRFKEQGLIASLVDLGDATQDRNTMGTKKVWLSKDPEKLLNEPGNMLAVNGAIMGINTAQGYDGGNFQNERYWPGGEDYELGKTAINGKPVERAVAGSQLVDESLRKEARESIEPKHIFDPLRRLATEIMGPELLNKSHKELYDTYITDKFIPGMFTFRYPAKRVVHEAFAALQAERRAGKDVTELTREFTDLSSLVYVKIARVSIIHSRELFELKPDDPYYTMGLANRKNAYESAKKSIKDAKDTIGFYGFYNKEMNILKNDWKIFNELGVVKDWRKKTSHS